MPTVFTDIDPLTGVSNNATRMDGALSLGGTRMARITDGTSHTLAIAEDSPVNYETVFPLIASTVPDPVVTAGNNADPPPPSKNRAVNRWAEPDNGIGISGPGNATPGALKGVVNNNSVPEGRPGRLPLDVGQLRSQHRDLQLPPRRRNGAVCATAACTGSASRSIRASSANWSRGPRGSTSKKPSTSSRTSGSRG